MDQNYLVVGRRVETSQKAESVEHEGRCEQKLDRMECCEQQILLGVSI